VLPANNIDHISLISLWSSTTAILIFFVILLNKVQLFISNIKRQTVIEFRPSNREIQQLLKCIFSWLAFRKGMQFLQK
jgi:hypothetical protein